MQPESIVKLIDGGNRATIEEEWMKVVESADMPLSELVGYKEVLSELRRAKKAPLAETLAWAAIEAVSGRMGKLETLEVARPFLVAVGDAPELRGQVVELYRLAYHDREGLEALLTEAGLGGGRPVRRAIRTLDICLTLDAGDFLASREENGAARVDTIDRKAWEFTITHRDGTDTLGAVHLADRYKRADSGDFCVMQQFATDALKKRLKDDPASVVTEVCRDHHNRLNSDTLHDLLVPGLVAEEEWKKWWARARTAIKRTPNIAIEGRSPYTILFRKVSIEPQETFLDEFAKLRDPLAQLACVRKYIRECKTRQQAPSLEVLRQCYERCCDQAVRRAETGSAGMLWMIAVRIGEMAEIETMPDGATKLLQSITDPSVFLASLGSDELVTTACKSLIAARPDDWREQVLSLFPTLPVSVCDTVATWLIDAGCEAKHFEPVVQRIVTSAVAHFGTLLWLWNGPSHHEQIRSPALVAIITRIFRALQEARISDNLPNEKIKQMKATARSALSARKYERFKTCVRGMDRGMAVALRTQIVRSDMLGRTVRDELLKELNRRFPPIDEVAEVLPWERKDVLFVTEAGLQRKTAETEEHVNVKMRDNARAIGRAAEHGDLSENSEYKFALEERDLLRARLAQMNSELALAQVLTPDDVALDHITIGSRAVFRRLSDGVLYELSFLGPWEADMDSGRINYLSPLAQKLMGKRVGDTVEFSHTGASGAYEVLSLHNALAE